MGTNSSKATHASASSGPTSASGNAIGEKHTEEHEESLPNSRVVALEAPLIAALEHYLTQESVTEVVLQRYGMKSVPDRGILLKPLRLEKMITLLLDYNQLQELPDFLALQPNISKVSLSCNQFKSTPSLGATVIWLDLSWNKIAIVDENVSSLIHLKHLDLRHNRLTSRSLPDLSDLSMLEYLDLSENLLTTWPRISSEHLHTLKIGYNEGLGDATDSLGPFPNLTLFSCEATRLRIFPRFLMTSERLEELNLRSTLINRLPMKLPYARLTRLDLSATKFVPSSESGPDIHDAKFLPPEKISDEVQASLHGLETLLQVEEMNLNGIGLLHLPDSLFLPQRLLTRLYLRWNNLFTLPEALFTLIKLEVLDVLGNKLSELSPRIAELSELRHLSLGHNRLMRLPAEITQLAKLECLVLEDNLWEDPELTNLYWDSAPVSDIFARILDSTKAIPRHVAQIPELKGTPEEQLKDRVYGLLFGQALGDAVGLSTEFLMHTQATFYCNSDSLELKRMLRDRHRIRWLPGDWTDDTDQALLLLDELLLRPLDDGRLNIQSFAKELLQWANDGFAELGDDGGMGIGQTVVRVLRHPLYLEHPHEASFKVWQESNCTLAANGALMRSAPVALFGFSSKHDSVAQDHALSGSDPKISQDGTKKSTSASEVPALGDPVSSLGRNCAIVRQNSIDACLVTHSDPRCVASCLALNMAICAILRGERSMEKVLRIAYLEGAQAFKVPPRAGVTQTEQYDEWCQELESLIESQYLHQLDLTDPSKLGYTYKCLGAAFAAFRSSNSFERSVLNITLLAGDADTNGAVAGALLGVKLGYSALPKHWIEAMPHRSWLEERAEKTWLKVRVSVFGADT